ncbi:ATP-dependent DNA helicase RecG [Bombilactobacillus bombi]|uniref:ATP-dependent DNA helicase RecG n=1 Tax=Bombilactobacillus bombi TaxID=1303590 RepID=UPI0015E61DEF|nr:ATP-dependent DNA helicase RecG [Bombilactobacillus bombi]MBA1434873.1 ATP-dependent DNA helicase RecG [Bombilactobacillus bombi]
MSELFQSVSYLNGVGAKTQQALADLGIVTIQDLLYYFPLRYEDLLLKSVAEAIDQEKIVLNGVVASNPVLRRFGYKKTLLVVRLLLDNETIPVSFFNQPWLQEKFIVGKQVLVYGRWNADKRSLTGMKALSTTNFSKESLDAVYPTNKKLHQKTLVKLIRQAVTKYSDQALEICDSDLRRKYHLLTETQIIQGMHFPQTLKQAQAARRSAKFRELYLYQLRLAYLKQQDQNSSIGVRENYNEEYVQQFVQQFGFELTQAQQRVLGEILQDMKSPQAMNRLLQGDVGSGKTAVAATAMFAAVTAGYQASLMAPTEILAQQHYLKLCPLFAQFQLTTVLLTSALTPAQRAQELSKIKSGRYNIIIGTQALFQTDVSYQRLGLVIIDEQHRFGVEQRRSLRQKGQSPDVLLMTATPIPRTLAITYYGEMDLSIIDELPAGRKRVETFWLRFNKMDQVQHFLKLQLQQQAQIFVIAPLISESEKMDLHNAEEIYQQLQQEFSQYRIALLHGQMGADQKDTVMQNFQDRQIDILVSTTVVEVGVDVPNASVMVIYNADRFGLSQLHQLRGRVGRGLRQSYCILLADPHNKTAIERLRIMTQTNDGFKLAQKDLQLRGFGDLFGNKQSGIPDFKVADPLADEPMLLTAHQEVQQLFASDPSLTHHLQLRTYLQSQQLDNLD